MSTENEHKRRVEIDWVGVENMLFKLLVIGAWSGVVIATSSHFGWMGDGFNLTDLVAGGMEIGGSLAIGVWKGPLREVNDN